MVNAFKKIEAYGFKSFADRVVIDFMGGITCIVGPNGCGKSNVSDAIRWVLGEQSSKALRGSQMQDVIFKGTENRKPMGYCEVSLHFDNTQKRFDIEYDDLVLTRKLFKSGESDYLINGKTARLKDIVSLLHDSGIDRDGLTIISQGQVSDIITSKPEGRRGIFEEAANIARFKHTKVDAERKLEKTNIELTRVRDVMAEIEKTLKPLMKQAENAQKYVVLRDELRDREIRFYVTQYDNASGAKATLKLELDNIDAGIKSRQGAIATATERIATVNNQIEGFDNEIGELREQVLDLSVGIEREQSNKRFEAFEKLGELKQERAGALARKRTIENLIESGEGYKFSVRKLLETKHRDIVGVVANELDVPEELENAIEVALGASAQNIITNDEDGAKRLIDLLKNQNFGRATFLPLTTVGATLRDGSVISNEDLPNTTGIIGVACNLVKFNAHIRPVVESLLGRTVVTDNLDTAIEVARQMRYSAKIVTIDGDVIETRGSVTGGSKNALNNNLWHNNQLNQINDHIRGVDARIADLERHIDIDKASGNQKIEALGKLDATRVLIENIAKKKDALRDEINRIETEKMALSEQIAALTHDYYKTEGALAKIDINIEQMQMNIDESYGMNYSACHMYLADKGIAPMSNAELEETGDRIRTLKRQISAIGAVNLDAIDEYRAQEARFTEYNTQVIDLEKAVSDLEKIIRDLGHEMTKKFKDSFEKINENFGRVFKELFGGGKASLELVPDADGKIDYLTCGIDILAEPAGKKLSNLTLLSGGEKALTAIAILFAILKLKPMPFCLLDEIEAALDEANVSRFANYLSHFSHETQFIVITHRKPTMELADNLYGITMEERGVSKVVSVKLENYDSGIVSVGDEVTGIVTA